MPQRSRRPPNTKNRTRPVRMQPSTSAPRRQRGQNAGSLLPILLVSGFVLLALIAGLVAGNAQRSRLSGTYHLGGMSTLGTLTFYSDGSYVQSWGRIPLLSTTVEPVRGSYRRRGHRIRLEPRFMQNIRASDDPMLRSAYGEIAVQMIQREYLDGVVSADGETLVILGTRWERVW